MSAFARSPESYAAWQQLKRNVALRPHDDEQRAQRERGTQELHRLLSRMSSIVVVVVVVVILIIVIHSPHPISIWEQKQNSKRLQPRSVLSDFAAYQKRSPASLNSPSCAPWSEIATRICASPTSKRASKTTAACSTNTSGLLTLSTSNTSSLFRSKSNSRKGNEFMLRMSFERPLLTRLLTGDRERGLAGSCQVLDTGYMG